MSPRQGFTLLELMLVVMIGSLIMAVAVPSVAGLMREQKLKQTFEEFDAFVRTAQTKAVQGRRTIVMVWEKEGINLVGLEAAPTESAGSEEGVEPTGAGETFTFAEGTVWTLDRPAALVKKPVWEWPFWRSGACEPVIVSFESPAGTWSAEYNGLTGRGKLTDMEVK